MNVLIGDIGNTITKICIIEIKTFKVKKIIYFNSNKISSKKFLQKKLKSIVNNRKINKVSLFSCVVPRYQLMLGKFLKKAYKIKFIEIKDKFIKKIIRINIKNRNQVGSDRIANAVGAYKRYKSNCIILDFPSNKEYHNSFDCYFNYAHLGCRYNGLAWYFHKCSIISNF